ncbi:MAG TPA: winged helix-turn-helix domain-containing protein [Candidatus Dormibacteraeota bacterium]|jgi:predicted transcriptional regulator|nr:winged helix-turn-helix domain-containing protein [Candidatus Dormibacteraeota bacterium]
MASLVLFGGNTVLTQRRDTTRLIHEILLLATDGASRYQMIGRIGLNHPQASSYISFLLENGHMEQLLDGEGRRKYLLTQKGKKLVHLLTMVQKEIGELFPESRSSLDRRSGGVSLSRSQIEQEYARQLSTKNLPFGSLESESRTEHS